MTNVDTTLSANSAERRLKEFGIELPVPPEPFGTYAEAVQTGNLLFLTGMLPTEGRQATFTGRIGAEIDLEGGRKAARLAALNALAVARQHLGSLDRVTRIVRLGVSWPRREMSRINRKSRMALRSCFNRSSEKRKTLLDWCMASRASRSALPSSWKSFSRWMALP